ncbi:MAG: hypothetical protein BroJett011_73610 [Chloroflexota bacterium]|nr:MAG: hypothetical protein BroJett011_73610 [Chloroflexota bacterium]
MERFAKPAEKRINTYITCDIYFWYRCSWSDDVGAGRKNMEIEKLISGSVQSQRFV